jgi:probable phosphoglycerate mutase
MAIWLVRHGATEWSISGFGDRVAVHEGLREYDYGEFEGATTEQIWQRHPGWELFRDGCPGGESPEQMSDRVDALLAELRALEGHVLLFGHCHCGRGIAARFLGLPIRAATTLRLDAGSLSILADGRDGPALVLWNRRVPSRTVLVADLARRLDGPPAEYDPTGPS